MNTHIIKPASGMLVGSALIVLAALPAAAQIKARASVTAHISASSTAASLSNVIAAADRDLSIRITALTSLNTRVQAMKNVSATEKSSISTEVQTTISTLTSLKAKIDAETDAKTARTDLASAINSTRIYALVIPQGYIEVSADRVDTISSMMTALAAKLQVRITAAQTAGHNVSSLQAALTDIGTQTAAANTQATAAVSAVATLSPDNGNATVAASNKTALTGGRTDLKTATQDLKTARQDIAKITAGLKGFHMSASATTTAQ